MLSIPPIGQHRVLLSWTASVPRSNSSNDAILGYCVYQKATDGSFVLISSTAVSGTSCVDDRVRTDVTYVYAVTAVDAQKRQSALSEPASVTIPDSQNASSSSESPPPSCWK
jgi:fibronectin type 3 domain-containing protein